jgi:hypothetical protein
MKVEQSPFIRRFVLFEKFEMLIRGFLLYLEKNNYKFYSVNFEMSAITAI